MMIETSVPAISEAATSATSSSCSVPSYSDYHLAQLVEKNCQRVDRSVADLSDEDVDESSLMLIGNGDEVADIQTAWQAQIILAKQLCEEARSNLALGSKSGLATAANDSMTAWGTVMMEGDECCSLTTPPYCIREEASISTILLCAPFVVLVILFFGSLCSKQRASKVVAQKTALKDPLTPAGTGGRPSLAALLRPQARSPTTPSPTAVGAGSPPAASPVAPATAAAPAAEGSSAGEGFFAGIFKAVFGTAVAGTADALRMVGGGMKSKLKRLFMKSCLRVLPEAEDMAEDTAGLFDTLQRTFDFQPDSVTNQYEHLISLLRSQAAIVADRSVQKEESVDESKLLKESLGDLAHDLLEGYRVWRQKLKEYEPAGLPDRGDDLHVRLLETVTFLLVWGEAGNLRFMPELIYFIAELVMTSDTLTLDELYGRREVWDSKSNRFLSAVVRPIYNVIFDEWYDRVEIALNLRDRKVLKKGYENYLPPSVANYDDWNELFCDPARLCRALLLKDGTQLFARPVGERFAALARLDWPASLQAAVTKTHREVHSLWGVFGTTHRVWLIHALLFSLGVIAVVEDPDESASGDQPVGGRATAVRFASVALLIPLHAVMWWYARWQVQGEGAQLARTTRRAAIKMSRGVCWTLPAITFLCVRLLAAGDDSSALDAFLVIHFLFTFVGLFVLLFVPKFDARYRIWPTTPVPLYMSLTRYTFWTVVFAAKWILSTFIFRAVWEAMVELEVATPGQQSLGDIASLFYSPVWISNFLVWISVWSAVFFLFVSDTQLWFTIACAVLGAWTVFVQRGCRCISWAFEDAVAKIPSRFSEKILLREWSQDGEEAAAAAGGKFSPAFPPLWDRIIEYMRYEDKIDNQTMGDLSFSGAGAGRHVYWDTLHHPLKPRSSSRRGTSDSEPAAAKVTIPDVFRYKTPVETALRQTCMKDPSWPKSADVQWRLIALARGLGLSMPRPFRAPFYPGITVLIPHYEEAILMLNKDLFDPMKAEVPLMHWLKSTYDSEFTNFTGRMQGRAGRAADSWPAAGSAWKDYTEEQWPHLASWASMRMQTLWRTVVGMCLYHPALQSLYELQGDKSSRLGKPGVWDPSDCFTCMVSMQMYKFLGQTALQHTNKMFDKMPTCLQVAFIDYQDHEKDAKHRPDNLHPRQQRRYFSCLVDRDCEVEQDFRRKPRLSIELPGYPILGDGKGDNQNHAIPFMRGHFAQCIDANQGAYFEQMLLLPCALGEFRSMYRGDPQAKRIVGFPEHITSDIGSIGDFAASAEVAFGTILQRTYAVLGGRMHYGHPDIMNKLFMIQQGGVSKATKTLNLSEDIFAGMDFTLRGQQRQIRHCEYFHLAKGRDLGFNTVLGFFSKLSSGTGEQVTTRQAFRLGQILPFPEAMTFYYAHVGYYFTQFLVSCSLPLLVFVWLLIILSDCEGVFDDFLGCQPGRRSNSEIMATLLGVWFSWLLCLFLVATSLPLFVEIWMERSFFVAIVRLVRQMFTLSPLLFIFQGKIIGHYVVNELRYGGATYVSTGRGLPTDRRPLVGELEKTGFRLKKVGGLYLDYAVIAYYDGAILLTATVLIAAIGTPSSSELGLLAWTYTSLLLVTVSWLLAPFVFNPYQFQLIDMLQDVRALVAFFVEGSGKHWLEWYDRTQLKRGSGRSAIDITFFLAAFLAMAWYASLAVKVEAFTRILSIGKATPTGVMLFPPMILSFAFCILIASLTLCRGVTPASRTKREMHTAEKDKAVTETPEASRPKLPQLFGCISAPKSDSAGSDQKRGTCCSCSLTSRVPMLGLSIVVCTLDMMEALLALLGFLQIGWSNAFTAGLLLKWVMICLLLHIAEGIVRSRFFPALRCFGVPLELWLYSHRMARDVAVSSLIVLAMVPAVLFNKLNDCLCPGLSLHHLLIYRNPNHLRRREA